MLRKPGEGLVHQLVRTCKSLRDLIHARMEEIGLPRGQGMILRRVGEMEGLTQTEVARQALLRSATLTRALQRMEHAGLIERRPDPEDQRVFRVYLTAQGRDRLQAVQAVWQELDRELGGLFTAQERNTLTQLLARLEQHLKEGRA